MPNSTAESILDRGVYRAPYLVDGDAVLIAVDSRGVARKHVKFRPGVDEDRAAEWLRALLDRIDPPFRAPKLTLIKNEEPAPKFDLRNALDAFTEERMARNPRYRARVNKYLAELASTPLARTVLSPITRPSDD